MSQKNQANHDRTKFSVEAKFKSFIYAFAEIKNFVSQRHNALVLLLAAITNICRD